MECLNRGVHKKHIKHLPCYVNCFEENEWLKILAISRQFVEEYRSNKKNFVLYCKKCKSGWSLMSKCRVTMLYLCNPLVPQWSGQFNGRHWLTSAQLMHRSPCRCTAQEGERENDKQTEHLTHSSPLSQSTYIENKLLCSDQFSEHSLKLLTKFAW